ncbi:hypothetical protein [Gemmata obscuriglobus]|uniref:Sel1 repeat family protein n=1 Tax=Gemmata obscuriglobus TaxID=114 RepID=A0A2Z3H0B2_9BACT|nr:hypothetical protein [Gemmata obscuriglobus]AWM38291.1 hypothetical protein C1280_15725 [Gemmata obscuriglobus]
MLPLAEAGNAEAQNIVGSLMMDCRHRFDTIEQWSLAPSLDAQVVQSDRDHAAQLLRAASEQGFGPASFNLASLLVMGHGNGTREERLAEAAGLYAKAYDQGFTAFGWLMSRDGPGQAFLDVMERYGAGSYCPCPWSPPATET